ncbi:thioredoxin fold domain-containing protein [Moraxella sp. Tifton1]|uniref:thioredoxin fold domain-containing protein n=1 Tax=Moraxella oculi TaxID=2940516 RepID=UPI002012702B|nr:thioredoxin fold domain-containing protein [Moraxella sp. Tifton1]MCL1624092.1 thioredoxin fold domain-containing protein [Moraxella sp. Tifton1]
MKKIITLLVISMVIGAAQGANPTEIRTMLMNAGLTAPIQHITPSPIKTLSQVTLLGQEPLLISDDLQYIILGNIETNPSKILNTDHHISTGKAGTPISQDHKKALLSNMTALTKIDKNAAFYHTNVKGVLWGIAEGTPPFLVSADGRHLINGEISVIKDGQFLGLDQAFETAKNRHVLSQLDEQTLVIYPAKGQEKAILYVVTDINCPYCRIFHDKIHDLNNKGVTIKAIGYPVYDESHLPMQQIWCQADPTKRALLLSAAMKGIYTVNDACQGNDSPIAHNQTVAHALAIIATPSILNEQGEFFEGDFIKSNDELLSFLHLK